MAGVKAKTVRVQPAAKPRAAAAKDAPRESAPPEQPQGDAGGVNAAETPAARRAGFRVTAHVSRWRGGRSWAAGQVEQFGPLDLSPAEIDAFVSDPGFTIDNIVEDA